MLVTNRAREGSAVALSNIGLLDNDLQTSLHRVNGAFPSNMTNFTEIKSDLFARSQRSMSMAKDLDTHLNRLCAAQSSAQGLSSQLQELVSLAQEASVEPNAKIRQQYGTAYDNGVQMLKQGFAQISQMAQPQVQQDSGSHSYSARTSDDPQKASYEYQIPVVSANSADFGQDGSASATWGQEDGQDHALNFVSSVNHQNGLLNNIQAQISIIEQHISTIKTAQTTFEIKSSNFDAAIGALGNVNDAQTKTDVSQDQIRRNVALSFLAGTNIQSSHVINLF